MAKGSDRNDYSNSPCRCLEICSPSLLFYLRARCSPLRLPVCLRRSLLCLSCLLCLLLRLLTCIICFPTAPHVCASLQRGNCSRCYLSAWLICAFEAVRCSNCTHVAPLINVKSVAGLVCDECVNLLKGQSPKTERQHTEHFGALHLLWQLQLLWNNESILTEKSRMFSASCKMKVLPGFIKQRTCLLLLLVNFICNNVEVQTEQAVWRCQSGLHPFVKAAATIFRNFHNKQTAFWYENWFIENNAVSLGHFWCSVKSLGWSMHVLHTSFTH